jgi:protein TonB
VVLVPASALESRQPSGTDAAAQSRIDDRNGAEAEEPWAEAAPAARKPPATESETQPVILAKPDPSPVETDLEIVVAEKPAAEVAAPRDEPQAEPTPTPPVASPAASPAPPVGGAQSAAVATAGTTGRAAAAASPGAVQRYARSIVELLGRARPRGVASKDRGTVRIAFAIAADGGLAYARVTASSGRPALDDAALAAVRQVRFPPPPAGMTSADLAYEIPYHFR